MLIFVIRCKLVIIICILLHVQEIVQLFLSWLFLRLVKVCKLLELFLGHGVQLNRWLVCILIGFILSFLLFLLHFQLLSSIFKVLKFIFCNIFAWCHDALIIFIVTIVRNWIIWVVWLSHLVLLLHFIASCSRRRIWFSHLGLRFWLNHRYQWSYRRPSILIPKLRLFLTLHTNLLNSVWHLCNLIVYTRNSKLADTLHMAHLMDII